MSIEGVYAAAVTPFRDDAARSIDIDTYLQHVDWLAARGVGGIVAFGTNGEGPSVSAHEKLAVLRALAGAPVPVIPTVAEANLPDTLALLAALEDVDAAAVMVLPPYFFKPVSARGLLDFYEPVVRATRHPVIVYHLPRYAIGVPPEVVAELPVWGVKDSGTELAYAEAVLAAAKGVLIGTEDDLWGRLGCGAQGVVSGLANAVPEAVVGVYEARREGDAERGAELSARLRRVREACPSPAARKRLASLRSGADLGTVRPPLEPVAADAALRALVDEIEAAVA
jgi:dihydrodipicolinate synthase/N-acetylneuraminate lyase